VYLLKRIVYHVAKPNSGGGGNPHEFLDATDFNGMKFHLLIVTRKNREKS